MHYVPDLDRLRRVGDTEADAVVERIRAHCSDEELGQLPHEIFMWKPGGQRPAPEQPIPAPRQPARSEPEQQLWAHLVAYLSKPYDLSGWDLARVERAQRAYQSYKNVGRAVLGIYSLPVLYIHPEIALTLMGTGRLLDHVRLRLDETQLFVDVVMNPGSLSNETSPGRLWVRKVRLMHAIRRALSASTERPARDPLEVLHSHVDWARRDDTPVDQLQVAYVMLTFSWAVIEGLAKLGRRYSMKGNEPEDHIYAWALIAHMIGVVDDLLPGGPRMPVQDAQALFEKIRSGCLAACGDKKAGANAWTPSGTALERKAGLDAGRQLMAALLVTAIELQDEHIPPNLRWVKRWRWVDDALQDLPRILVRKLAGVPTARMLYLGRAPFAHWLICRAALWLIDLRNWPTGGSSGALHHRLRAGPSRSAAQAEQKNAVPMANDGRP